MDFETIMIAVISSFIGDISMVLWSYRKLLAASFRLPPSAASEIGKSDSQFSRPSLLLQNSREFPAYVMISVYKLWRSVGIIHLCFSNNMGIQPRRLWPAKPGTPSLLSSR